MNFSKGAGSNRLRFPLTQAAIDALQPSALASPRVGNPNGLRLPSNFDVDEVMKVRADMNIGPRGMCPKWFLEKYYPPEWGAFPDMLPQPLVDEGLSYDRPKGLANVVHMDKPWALFDALQNYLIAQGQRPNELQARDHTPFLDVIPGCMPRASEMIDNALEAAFAAKYYFGVQRPEEVMAYNMTHYEEGCPTHPSYPAGHGAAAGATAAYFLENWDLSAAMEKVVKDSCYLWAQFRTLAGVHYWQDNVAGLMVGGLDMGSVGQELAA